MSAQARETRPPEPAGLRPPARAGLDDRGLGRRGLLPSVKIGRRRLYIRPKIEAQLLVDASAQRLR